MTNSAIVATTDLGVLVGMIVLGSLMQSAHAQWGLIASQLVCILAPALLVRHVAGGKAEFARFRSLSLSPMAIAWVVATSLVLGLAANAVTGLLAELVPALGEIAAAYEQTVKELLYPGDAVLRAAAVAGVVAVAPVCEEILFRGTLLPLQRRPGRTVAGLVIANGLMFSFLHLNPVGFFALAVIGAFFAHLVVLTGSIWPAILGHATLNFVNGVVVVGLSRDVDAVQDPNLMEYVAMSAVLVPVVAALWALGSTRLFSGNADA